MWPCQPRGSPRSCASQSMTVTSSPVAAHTDRLAVRVVHELQPRLARGPRVHVGQVETIGLRVDLEERACLERLLDHALEVDRRRLPLADLAVRDVADAVDVRALHR